jgi:hypothetical protein
MKREILRRRFGLERLVTKSSSKIGPPPPHRCITRAPDMALKQPQAPIRRRKSKAKQSKQATRGQSGEPSSEAVMKPVEEFVAPPTSHQHPIPVRLPNQSHKAKNSLTLTLEPRMTPKTGYNEVGASSASQ